MEIRKHLSSVALAALLLVQFSSVPLGQYQPLVEKITAQAAPACSDANDNDGDGLVDMQDPGCTSPTDNDEFNLPQQSSQCNDNNDNDGDTLVDAQDPGCHSDGNANNPNSYDSNDNNESNAPTPPPPPPPSPFQCSDSNDNDGDGLADAQDPGCHSDGNANNPNSYNSQDNSESNPPPQSFQCSDNFDNDGDGATDFPADTSCTSPDDNDELNPRPQVFQCSDNNDNDGDGLVDAQDPGCTGPTDNDETNAAPPPPPQCSDGFDNDGDGATDLADFSCLNGPNAGPGDNDELNPKPQCLDGQDNDQDGVVDGADPGCHTDGNPNNPASHDKQDNDETNPAPNFTISKQADRQVVHPGEFITYTVTLHNNGNFPQQNIRIVDEFPQGVTYDPQGSTPGCNQQGGNIVACNPITVGPNQTVQFFLRFRVDDNRQCGNNTTMVNRVKAQQGTTDITTNQTSTVQVDCPAPQFTASKQADRQVVRPGEFIVYTVTVQNTGNTTQQNIRLVDTFPQGLTYDDGGSTPECDANGGQIVCQPRSFNPGQTFQYQLRFRVDDNRQCGPGQTLQNSAVVQQGTTNIVTTNVATTQVDCDDPNFSVVKTSNQQNAFPGDIVTYTVTIRNEGNTPQQNIRIVDQTPQNTTFEPNGSTPGCFQSGNFFVICQPGTVNPGQTVTTTLRFRINDNHPCGNSVLTNSASVQKNNVTFVTSQPTNITVQCPVPQFSATKTANVQSVTPGDFITYTVTVQNTGTSQQNGIRVIDIAPQGTTFQTQGSSPDCAPNNQGQIVCQDRNFAPGQTAQFQFRFQVNANRACGQNQDLLNIAEVRAQNGQTLVTATNTVSTPVQCPPPNFSATKTADRQTVRPGQVITYTIALTNNGQTTQQGISVVDTIPQGTTFLQNGSSPTCLPNNQGQIVCQPQDFAPGQTVTYTLRFTVNQGQACGGNNAILNRADVRQGQTLVTSTNTSSTPVQCNTQCSDLADNDGDGVADFPQDPGCTSPDDDNEAGPTDIAISMEGPSQASEGSIITYFVTVTNNGPDNAPGGLAFRDDIPQGLTFIPNGSDPRCQQEGNAVICDGFGLAVGASTNFTLNFQVDDSTTITLAPTFWQKLFGIKPAIAAPLCNTTIVNTVTITTVPQGDPNLANNTATVTTFITCADNLSITKSGPATANVGQIVTYTLSVTNNGAATQTGLQISDVFPAQLAFQTQGSTPGCTAAGNTVTCLPQNLLPGQTASVTLNFMVDPAAQCNASFVNTGHVRRNNATLASSSVTTQALCPPAQLYVTKDGPPTVNAGGTITYNFTLQNVSNFPATNVTLTDYFVNQQNQQVTPSPFTFQSSSLNGCVFNAQNQRVQCPIGTLAPQQLISFTMTFSVPNNPQLCNQQVINYVGVVSNGNMSTLDTDVTTTTVQCAAATFAITKQGPTPAVVSPGDIITYLITATNTGQAGQTVNIVDVIPQGLTFEPNGSTQGCGQVGQSIVCANQTVAGGASLPFTIKFRADLNLTCNSTIINTATVQQNNVTLATSNAVSTTVNCTAPQLDVQKTAPATSQAGGTVTYSFHVTNTSATQVAQDIKFVDFFIDANNGPIQFPFTFASSSLPPGSCFFDAPNQNVSCNLGNLNPLQSIDFTLIFNIPQTGACGIVRNQVDVWPALFPNDTAWDKAQTNVICAPQTADLSIVKSSLTPTVVRGTAVTYDVTVTNAGPAAATNVQFVDTVPSGLTFVTNTGNATCTSNGSQVTCVIGNLASGASQTVSLVFNTETIQNCTQPATVTNSVTLSSSPTDPNPANNNSSIQTTLACPPNQNADVSVIKSVPATPVVRGNTFTYSVVVSNLGPGTAQGIILNDLIPADLELVSVSGPGSNCITANNSVSCAIGTLASGSATQIIAITVRAPVQPNCTQSVSITNTATVTAISTDPVSTNNSSNATVSVTCPAATDADVAIAKSGPSSVAHGASLTYQVTVTNNGPAAATNVQFVDTVPSGLTFVTSTGNATCTSNGSQVTCSVGNLASGASQTVSLAFTANANPNCTVSSQVVNSVTLSQLPNDPNNANNTATATTTLTCVPATTTDLSVTKTGPTTGTFGSNITYRVTVTNAGPASVNNVTFADTVPVGLTFVSQTGATNCTVAQVQAAQNTAASAIVNCDLGTMTSGQQKIVDLVFSTQAPASCTPTLVNQVQVTENDANVTETNSANNSAQASTTFTCPPTTADVGLTKTLTSSSSVQRGSSVTYGITVTNAGPASATNVTVQDTFNSSEFNFVSSSGVTCTASGNQLSCPIGTMTSGQTTTINLTFTAKTSTGTCTTASVTNTASVTTSSTDNNSGNNSSTAQTVQLTCPASSNNFSVQKTDNESSISTNRNLRYSITITNNDTSNALTNVNVTDTLPSGVSILTVSDGGSINGQTVTWNNLTVGAGNPRVLHIDVFVGNLGGTTLRNTVTATAGGNTQTASDDTFVNQNVVNPPPPPPYYNPPPPYYNPPPPIYYNPPPPPYYNPPPPVFYPEPQYPGKIPVYPITGTRDANLYADPTDRSNLQRIADAQASAEAQGFPGVVYATLVAFLAVGSAAASKFVGFSI